MLPTLLAVLAATASAPCALPDQTPMVVTQLFFGRDIEGRAPLTDAEWSDYVAAVLAKDFPDGFTVTDGDGQWLDPRTHLVAHERSKIVIVASKQTSDLARRTAEAMNAYRVRFHQESVGVLTTTECGSF
jgi:hypothetical protein